MVGLGTHRRVSAKVTVKLQRSAIFTFLEKPKIFF